MKSLQTSDLGDIATARRVQRGMPLILLDIAAWVRPAPSLEPRTTWSHMVNYMELL